MDRADVAGRLAVTVAYSPGAGVVDVVTVEIPPSSTLHDAIRASGVLERHPAIDLAVMRTGVWGKFKPLDAVLRDRDRVEIYRPLLVDPKQARRERYRKQRAAG
jgi:uncharacterized protein